MSDKIFPTDYSSTTPTWSDILLISDVSDSNKVKKATIEASVASTTIISEKADKTNVLELDNTTAFTPNADYEPATKKYVDDTVAWWVTADSTTTFTNKTVNLTSNTLSWTKAQFNSALSNWDFAYPWDAVTWFTMGNWQRVLWRETDFWVVQELSLWAWLSINGATLEITSWAWDVVWPAIATDNAIARFDSTTGKLIQNSWATIDDTGSINIPTWQAYKINGTDLKDVTETLTNKTVTDSTFTIQDDADNTKKAKFQASWITAWQTRTFTLPNNNGTVIVDTWTQTISDKTLDACVIQIGNTDTILVDQTDTSKQVVLDASWIGTGTAKAFAFPNQDWTFALTSQILSDTDKTDLTDAWDTALHYHSSDRNRSNHTGTQTASTISDFDAASVLAQWAVSYEVTWFKNQTNRQATTDCTISWDDWTRTLTVTPVWSYSFWYQWTKYTKNSVLTTTIANTTWWHFIFFDSTGTLVNSTTPWNLLTSVPVCFVRRNATLSKWIPYEERHWNTMDWMTHSYLHSTRWTQYLTWLEMSWYTLDTNWNAAVTYSMSTWTVSDEDLVSSITALADWGPYTILERSGASWDWTWTSTNTVPYLHNWTNIQFNEFTWWVWTKTAVTVNNRWVNYYIAAVPSIVTWYQFLIIPWQAEYTSLANANAETFANLSLWTLPAQENVVLYRYIMRRWSWYTADWQARLVQVDLVRNSNTTIAQAWVVDHWSLSWLTDDDHTQYQLTCSTQSSLTDYTFTGAEVRNAWYSVSTTWWNRTINVDADLFSTGYEFAICKGTNDVNTVTLDAQTGNTIDWSQTYVIRNYNETITLVKDWANVWKIKNHYKPATASQIKSTDIASATTTNLLASNWDFIDITGTTTITWFGTADAWIEKTLRFTWALTLTYNATSLIIPWSANITTANWDSCKVRSLWSWNWQVVSYTKRDWTAIVGWGWWASIQTVSIAGEQTANTEFFRYVASASKTMAPKYIQLESLPTWANFVVTWYKNWASQDTTTITTWQSADANWDYTTTESTTTSLASWDVYTWVITTIGSTVAWSNFNCWIEIS